MAYAQDSLFTLTAPQIAAVLALSLVLSVGVVSLFWWLRPRRRLPAVVWAIVLLWVFEWLSPQVYYQLYLVMIDGLPWQIVPGWPPPGPGVIAALLVPGGQPDLSHLGRAALGWTLLILAMVPRPARG